MDATHEEIQSRLKSAEIVIKWLAAILTGLVIAGAWIVKMRYDLDNNRNVLEGHSVSIRALEHNDAAAQARWESVMRSIARIENKLDK